MKYTITIRYTKRGEVIKEEILNVDTIKEPKVGDTIALLSNPPIYKTITKVVKQAHKSEYTDIE